VLSTCCDDGCGACHREAGSGALNLATGRERRNFDHPVVDGGVRAPGQRLRAQGADSGSHSCEGEDLSPPLSWSGVPEGTRSLALIVDDPDAPVGTLTHWLAWGLDPAAEGVGEGEAAPVEGRNDFGTGGYRGPCPPPGHGHHRYFLRLYALDFDPDLQPGATKRELEHALEGHTLAVAELIGSYER
jgi:Raf kinase inhibitor-like YbhB/YbcL family protein